MVVVVEVLLVVLVDGALNSVVVSPVAATAAPPATAVFATATTLYGSILRC